MLLWKNFFGARRRARSAAETLSVGDLIAQADIFRDKMMWGEAATSYSKALSLDSSLADIWVQMGNSLKESKNYKGAQEAYEKAISLNAQNADYYLQLGHLCKLGGRVEEAIQYYSKAVALDSSSDAAGELRLLSRPSLQIERGDRARDQQQWAEAELRYREALAIDSQLDPIWIQLGHSLKEQGKLKEAEEAYRKAAEINEVDPESFIHIGHVLGMQGKQKDAVAAYGRALRLQLRNSEVFNSLNATSGHIAAQAENEAFSFLSAMESSAGRDVKSPLSNFRSDSFDVMIFPNVDWRYRKQRSQHLARYLGVLGKRVIYISTVFDPSDQGPGYRIISNPQLGVSEVRLFCVGGGFLHGESGLLRQQQLGASIRLLVENLRLCAPVLIVQHPSWQGVLADCQDQLIVYDCLDYVQGFAKVRSGIESSELSLLASADLVLCASAPILERLSKLNQNTRLLRNGVEVEKFGLRELEPIHRSRPVIGYCGALAEWFNTDWLVVCAEKNPEWDFVLIGRVENPIVQKLRGFANVRFFGEREYSELPKLFRGIDVGIIPFLPSELTRHTNPVKLYEYLAAGKPVVATRALEDLTEKPGFIYLADDAQSFRDQIARALAEDTAELRRQRLSWAQLNHWSHRAADLLSYVEEVRPRIDVILFGDIPLDDHIDGIARLHMSQDAPYFNSITLLAEFAKPSLLQNGNGFYERNDVSLKSERDFTAEFICTPASQVALVRLGSIVSFGWVLPMLKQLRDSDGDHVVVNVDGEISMASANSGVLRSASIVVASTRDMHKVVEAIRGE